jgi:4-hydroxy-3-methylbut-2-enyl diphosphate reductase
MTEHPKHALPDAPDSPIAPDGLVHRGFGLKAEVAGRLDEDYHSPLIERIRQAGNAWAVGGLRFRLATHFGFCYGVDKAIDHAYQARERFADRRIFLTTEIIHNPRVNERLRQMGVSFLSGHEADDVGLGRLEARDVVILPAFGVATGLLDRLSQIGCVLVDTTCGSVVHVWKRVERYAREGFTSVIHGKWWHEETVATASHADAQGGRHLVVLTIEDAAGVCDFIRRGCPAQDAVELAARFKDAMSAGFDFCRDLDRVGVANQTTMLSSESLKIAEMFRRAMADRFGEAALDAHFMAFDTICNATQERQDAIREMMQDPPDLMLVVGGFNSSNTTHLAEMTARHCPTYHVDDARRLLSPDRIEHCPASSLGGKLEIAEGWLPARRPLTIGLTAGASTPNRVIGEVIERLAAWEEAAGVKA